MGLPVDDTDFADYLKVFKDAYNKLHMAGVVHLDGFPSNILWKKSEEGYVIKFVDFDVATFVDRTFDSGIQENIRQPEFESSYYYWNETERASVKHDAWFVFIYSQIIPEERKKSFAAGRKKDIDEIVSNYWVSKTKTS